MKSLGIALGFFLLATPQDRVTMKVEEIVDWVSKKSGLGFVYDAGIDAAARSREIEVAPGMLDPARAYETGLLLLRSAQIAAVPVRDGKRVRLVHGAIASKGPLEVFSSVEALPKADEFCTLVLSLRHLSPRELQATLINTCSFPQNCLSIEASGCLVLSDYASNLRKMAEIARQADIERGFRGYRIDVALLEGTRGDESEIPESYRSLRLVEVTGKNRFARLGEASARVDLGDLPAAGPGRPPAPAESALRFGGPLPVLVEFAGRIAGERGPTLERFTVRLDKDATQAGPRLLETRLELGSADWTLAGSVPTEKEGASLVVLVRAAPSP